MTIRRSFNDTILVIYKNTTCRKTYKVDLKYIHRVHRSSMVPEADVEMILKQQQPHVRREIQPIN